MRRPGWQRRDASGSARALAHDGDFLLDQVAAYSRQIIGNAGSGSMGAVSSAKCIVYINFSQGSQLLCKSGIVLFLFLVETDVFDQHRLRRLSEKRQMPLALFADNVGCHFNLLAQQLWTGTLATGAREYFMLNSPFGRPRWEQRITFAFMSNQIFDGLQSFVNTLGIADVSFGIKRNVEVAAYQNASCRLTSMSSTVFLFR